MSPSSSAAQRITLQAQTADACVIKVVGIGELGETAIAEFSLHNNPYVECIAFAPDVTATNISYGREAHAYEAYQLLVHDADMLFVVAQAGNAEAGKLAALARALGIFTIAVLAQPDDGGVLQPSSDADLSVAAQAVNLPDVLWQVVHGMVNSVQQPGLLNLDMEDVQKLLRGRGAAQVSTGKAAGAARALQATEQALCGDMTDVKNVLIAITSTSALKLAELEVVMNAVAQNIPDALAMVASVFDEDMGDALRVTLISTTHTVS